MFIKKKSFGKSDLEIEVNFPTKIRNLFLRGQTILFKSAPHTAATKSLNNFYFYTSLPIKIKLMVPSDFFLETFFNVLSGLAKKI